MANEEKLAMMYEAAMTVLDQEDADDLFAQMVQETLRLTNKESTDENMQHVIKIVKHNLGYKAGYYNDATRYRVETLFRCEHPIMGRWTDNKNITGPQALEMGMYMGGLIKDGMSIEDAIQKMQEKFGIK